MITIIKVLTAVIGVSLLTLGLTTVFFPDLLLHFFEIKPTGVYGMNNVRADIGGLLTGCGVMIGTGLRTKQKLWIHAALLLIALVFLGRLVSLMLDGWTNAAIPAMVMEVLAMAVLVSCELLSVNG